MEDQGIISLIDAIKKQHIQRIKESLFMRFRAHVDFLLQLSVILSPFHPSVPEAILQFSDKFSVFNRVLSPPYTVKMTTVQSIYLFSILLHCSIGCF